ncbi:hypothetical protein DV711_01765 [Motiliproteus coralliicola]|uniref:GNAT family N-acetyltransferase n=1 Tax=Motiliproteus coralliicola TaxID=2283196 RepID=A0A369WT67_9GAMM|nr:hypothetical protein [Motiliproteus coralliicola]RDE24343.1 hypothetical protein DV711_01765 [Motiliproteus coralliicola]
MSIHFQLATEPAKRLQYFNIRQFCFRNDLGLYSFDGSEDQYDREGEILLIMEGNQCIGGARLSGSLDPVPLPLEHEGLNIQQLFPNISGTDTPYCQWTRLAVHPSKRTPQLMAETAKTMLEIALVKGYQYSFCVSGRSQARLYKRLYNNLGYDYRIMEQIEVPEEPGFKGLPHLLSICDLTSASEQQLDIPRVA